MLILSPINCQGQSATHYSERAQIVSVLMPRDRTICSRADISYQPTTERNKNTESQARQIPQRSEINNNNRCFCDKTTDQS